MDVVLFYVLKRRTKMKANKLSYGLFMFHGTRWWRNLKDIPIFIERIFFTLKHGYSPVAKWGTDSWFIDVMKEIVINYRYNRVATPVIVDISDECWDEEKHEENIIAYNKILDKMIALLDRMDENNEIYDNIDGDVKYKLINDAKNEFFELFSEHFYGLWN